MATGEVRGKRDRNPSKGLLDFVRIN